MFRIKGFEPLMFPLQGSALPLGVMRSNSHFRCPLLKFG